MSTRSAIIAKIGEGYVGVYCHCDGYLEGVGRTLAQHYTADEKIKELLELGDMSELAERISPPEGAKHSFDHRHPGVTVAYQRDRGETSPPTKGRSVRSVASRIGHDGHVYVWEGGKWTHNGVEI